MILSKNQIRHLRRKARKKQCRTNKSYKSRLYKDKGFAPCFYCKKVFLISTLTVEHIIPLCLGGISSDDNLTLACAPCNQERGKQVWQEKKQSEKYDVINY